MKTQSVHRFVSFLVIALLTVGLWLGGAAPVRAFATVLYVAPGSGCTGISNCFATIQAAVDVAADGTTPQVEIRVAAGMYTDIHDCPRNDITTTGTAKAVVCLSKTLTIRGGYNPTFTVQNPATYVTTLDAESHGRGIYITGVKSPTIDGLSITGGNASGLTGHDDYTPVDAGGGVYIMTANATLTNNRIFNNTSPSHAGGVYIGYSNSQLSGNTINNNSVVTGSGGGIVLFHSGATLAGNKILSNTSGNVGGGLYTLYSNTATFVKNTVSANTAANNGGGIDIAACSPSLSGNLVTGNSADWGGGIVLWYSSSTLTNNVIENNQASSTGSGIWIGGSTPALLHNTISHNTGGDGSGVYASDDGNTPAVYSVVTIKNSIIANQTIGVRANTGSTYSMDGVLWYNNVTDKSATGVTVTHWYSGNPRFTADGYHLTKISPAINKGVDAGVTTDIDGEARLGIPDLGADEYWWSTYLPLVRR